MDTDKKEIALKRKENLIDLLDLLSNTDRQIEYAKIVGDVVAIGELDCMWFDGAYNPDDKVFLMAYNDNELLALKKFNDYYNSISRKIPQDNINTLLADHSWKKLVSLAADTKNKLIVT